MIGRTLGHYKIIEKLGEGGMGVVYRAEDQKLERPVALKMLPAQMSASHDNQQRFMQEARAASALNHPNVATIYGLEETPEHTFIVMEFVDGENLSVARPQLSIDRIIDIAIQICDGLAAAHERGIIHRDIKPENIMLAASGRVKITDFGVAMLVGRSRLTDPGARVGTLAYTSPEQIQGGSIGARTDLWSLGVLLYEVLTGQLPFLGDYDAALLYEVLNAEPMSIKAARVDVPEHLEGVVFRLLEKDPRKRPDSAREVIEELKHPVSTDSTSEPGECSISVLYFENMSPDKENEYVCAGITEDIITDLSKIQGLNVVPRSDVLPFRNREVNTRELGESLGVDYVLEGSVRKSGDKLRITTQLTDVRSGFHVWAERFDRLVEDIFELQNEVANKVAAALKISLTDVEKETLAQKPTGDVRAYDFYLRAREFLSHRGKNKTEAAVQMLENALAIDGEFALAYTGLAEAYSSMFTYYDGDRRWLDKIIDVSEKALEIDPGLVEAQFSLGIVRFHRKEFDRARDTFEEVIERRPYHYDSSWWLGIIADIQGDYEKALAHYEMAAAIKPYSVEPWLYMNMTHRRKGDMNGAKRSAKQFLVVGIRKLEVNPDDPVTLSRFAVIYTLFGEHEKARGALTRILESHPDDGLVLYNCASTYALLHDEAQSLRCLRMALENGFKNVREWVVGDPDFDALRGGEEFAALLAEFGDTGD